MGGFTIGQAFLLGTTLYVAPGALMVFATLVLPPHLNRIANIALSIVYSATIVVGAIGEWGYYVLGSAIEVALLAAIVTFAWTWQASTGGRPALRSSVERAEVRREVDLEVGADR
jgi:hypothetical protein